MIGLSSALAPTIDQGGLQLGVGPATLWLNGVLTVVPFSFVFLNPNTTSYIFLNTNSALVNVNETGFVASNIPIAIVTTNLDRIVTYVDTRPDFTNIGGGGGGGTGPNFIDAQVPSGVINGVNTGYTLSVAPSPATSLILTQNGVTLQQGVDYTLVANTITFAFGNPPQVGDSLLSWYRFGSGAAIPNFADGEIPSGAIDGVNNLFTVLNDPSPSGSLMLIRNGVTQMQGSDYSLSANNISFFIAPLLGDSLEAWYRY